MGLEPISLATHDFESCAYTNSATPAHYFQITLDLNLTDFVQIIDLIYSRPMPDFKYFSLILADSLSGYSSMKIISNGAYGLVVLLRPELC